MEISYLILIITCCLYGATTGIEHWEEFGAKLINVLALIALTVLTLITGEDGFLQNDSWWLNYVFPAGAIFLGLFIGYAIDDDDWKGICVILSILGLIATIITSCCGV